MAIYTSKNEKSVFISVEIGNESPLAVFHLRHELDIGAAKTMLEGRSAKVVAQTSQYGNPVLVVDAGKARDTLLTELARDGEAFAAREAEKRGGLGFLEKHGWKIRASTSIGAQVLQIVDSLLVRTGWDKRSIEKAGNEGKNAEKGGDNASLFGFAAFNLSANAMNLLFGSEKPQDDLGFRKINAVIESEVNRFLPDDSKFELSPEKNPDNLLKTQYMSEAELAKPKPDPTREWLRKNSVGFGEIGLRMLGTFSMIFNPQKWGEGLGKLVKGDVTGAYNTARTQNTVTHMSGIMIMAGKVLGIFSKAPDKLKPPRNWGEKFAEDAAWTGSSIVEFIGTVPVLVDAAMNKKRIEGGTITRERNEQGKLVDVYHHDGKTVTDGLPIAAQILNASAYPVKAALPKAELQFDFAEIEARTIAGLLQLHDAGKASAIPDVLARIVSDIDEHTSAKSPGFRTLYSGVLNKLEKFHGIAVLSGGANEVTDAAPVLPAISKAEPEGEDLAKEAQNTINRLKIVPRSLKPQIRGENFEQSMQLRAAEVSAGVRGMP